MRNKRLHRENKVSSKEEKEKKTHSYYKIEPCNKTCQSLFISNKETHPKRPFAKHHKEAKKATLS